MPVVVTLLLLCTIVYLAAAQTCIITPSDNQGNNYRAGVGNGNGVVCSTANPGTRMELSGFTRDSFTCNIIPDVQLEVWQPNTNGTYLNNACRGTIRSDSTGRYSFSTVVPGRHDNRPRHIHFRASAPNYNTLTTQIYFAEDTTSCDTPACSLSFMRLNLTNASPRTTTLDMVMIRNTPIVATNTNTASGDDDNDNDNDVSVTGAIAGALSDDDDDDDNDNDNTITGLLSDDDNDNGDDDNSSHWWPALVFPLLCLLCCAIAAIAFLCMKRKKKKRRYQRDIKQPPTYPNYAPTSYPAPPLAPIYYHTPNPNPTPSNLYHSSQYNEESVGPPITVYDYTDYPPGPDDFTESF